MKRVLVVGGASGIGAASVRKLRSVGASVVIADLDTAVATTVAAEPGEGQAWAFGVDMADPTGPRRAVETAVERMGGLDGVFGNAGVLSSAPLEECSVQSWNHALAVNLTAPFLLAQASVAHLEESGHGSMLFTASTGAFRGHAGMHGYHASKGGLVNLVRSLADELGPRGVRVNAVCPGWIDTPFNDPFWSHQVAPDLARENLERSLPLRRQGTPEEVAEVVMFLLSEASRYVTGEALVVDGGYLAC